ncbi:MAG: FCD domain-containing protein [Rhizobiales bacterium]|nr:FCD domain-containing protein [Hyphomicrobiales bacterium]
MTSGKTSLYETLTRKILTLELPPGHDLDEASLSAEHGISRTPVREVLRRLQGEGYVMMRENRGARVAPMNLETLREFFLVVSIVYEAVGRLAVKNFASAQLAELEACQLRFRAAVAARDVEAMTLENRCFHAIIGDMANNVFLKPSYDRLLIDHTRIGHTFYDPTDTQTETNLQLACRHHDEFIEAIAGRDEAVMARLTHEHLELSRRNMEIYVAPKSMPSDANARPRKRQVA